MCYQAGYHWGPLGYNPVARQWGYLSTSCCPSHIEVCSWGYLFSGTPGLPRTWPSMLLGSAERPQAENGGLPGKQPSEVEVRAEGIWAGCPQHLLWWPTGRALPRLQGSSLTQAGEFRWSSPVVPLGVLRRQACLLLLMCAFIHLCIDARNVSGAPSPCQALFEALRIEW